MSVLDPRELQASPLADLHALATELGLEGFRRLRKQDLINQIVAAQGGEVRSSDDDEPEVALYADASAEPEAAGDVSAPGAVEDDQEDLHEGSTADVPRDYQEPMPNWEQERDEERARAEEPADRDEAPADRDEVPERAEEPE